MKLYKIADFIFGVHMDESLDIPENFKKFEISSSPEDIQTEYFIKIVDEARKKGEKNPWKDSAGA